MQVFNTSQKVIITCNKRLSGFLAQEIVELGFSPIRTFPTGVELNATVSDCIKLNLNLRTASQILYLIEEFEAQNADELYQAVKEIAWESILATDGYFSVNSNVDNDTISTPLFANLKVKDAIVDRIKQEKGIRPNSGPDTNKAVIHLYWKNERASVFLDTSGETLAKHGYRKHPGKAPMLEALASGVIFSMEWNRQTAFVNPMCGSGTLAIEAALIAGNRKPGLLRMNYAFMHVIGYDELVFFAERRILKDQINKKITPKIIATDISREAIDIARMNAKTAGVDQLIDFHCCDFAQTPIPDEAGVIIFNPEYGERLGVHTNLEQTYKRIGDFMKQDCKGYKGFVFTGNQDLAKKIGLKTYKRVEFYNGKLDCRLLSYELYEGTRRTEDNKQNSHTDL